MKGFTSFRTLAAFALLASCSGGHHAPQPTSPPPPPAQLYTIGGRIDGLTATGLTLANGSDVLDIDAGGTSFTFPTQLGTGAAYNVSIAAQPSGERCSLTAASGTVSTTAVGNITVTCTSRLWTWLSGSDVTNQTAIVGTQGVPDSHNIPGARRDAVSWTDQDGNLWLFSGEAIDVGYPNDLWKYSPTDGTWTLISGTDVLNSIISYPGVYGTLGTASPTNAPGGRHWASAWIDAQNNLWLFGGIGYDATGTWGLLNDLWKFTPANGEWTWVSGSSTAEATSVYGTKGVAAPANTPGDRDHAASWIDANSNLWLYGGFGDDATGQARGDLADVWKFDTTTSQWTWVDGVTSLNQISVYPPLGTSTPAATPGGRDSSVTWIDNAGNFWLFGGSATLSATTGGILNDLWRYSPSNGTWSWMSGGQTPNAAPTYGTLGIADSTHGPGAMIGALTWTDSAGQLWMFGGYWQADGGFGTLVPQETNALWEYRPSTGKWTWVSGSETANIAGVYGTLGIGAATNLPGSRCCSVGWIDKGDNLWLFGGGGYADSPTLGYLNDLWKY